MPAGVGAGAYVAALLGAAVILGIAKSGFGGGIGILAVPLTANVLPADRALGVMLPMLLVGDVFASAVHARHVAWPKLWPVVVGAAVGIGGGAILLARLQDAASLAIALNLTVGGLCLGIVALQAYRLAGGRMPRVPATPPAGAGVGLVSGVVSTLAHSAGPIAAVYLLEIKLDKARFVATAAWLFFLMNLLKLPAYLGLGLVTGATLLQSAWAAAGIPVGTALGLWMHRRIPEKPFAAIVYLGAAAAAGRMVWTSLA